MCVYTCVCVYIHVYAAQKAINVTCPSQFLSTLILGTELLAEPGAYWLTSQSASKPQGYSHLHFPRAGMINTHHSSQLSPRRWGWHSLLHTHMASALPADSDPKLAFGLFLYVSSLTLDFVCCLMVCLLVTESLIAQARLKVTLSRGWPWSNRTVDIPNPLVSFEYILGIDLWSERLQSCSALGGTTSFPKWFCQFITPRGLCGSPHAWQSLPTLSIAFHP